MRCDEGTGKGAIALLLDTEEGFKRQDAALMRAALRHMGYSNGEMTAQGFRAMARTLIIKRLPGMSPDVIEAQLAHGKSGPLRSAYDRAEFMEQRRQMMATWANHLDQLRRGAQVVPIKRCTPPSCESQGRYPTSASKA